MKKIIYLMMLFMLAGCGQAQDLREWKVNFNITDEAGQPVDKAAVTVFYTRILPPDKDSGKVTGVTDTNGVCKVAHRDRTVVLRFLVEKEGFYSTDIQARLHRANRPEELNRNLNLVLKKVGKPIGMFAKRVNTHVPDLDKPLGFDLEVGDWSAPHGKGVKADINFTGHFDKYANGESDFTLTVSFPKNGDGIKEFFVQEAEKGSGLRSPHEAPEDGYQPKWVQTDKRKPGKPIETNQDPNRNYIFRVRTVLDQDGKVVSAHYGKIYGDFMKFDFYLNPIPNSKNIEFDPNRNLLGGLQSFEQVSAP